MIDLIRYCYLMFHCLQSEECEFIGGVEVPDNGPGSLRQLGDQAAIVNCGGAVQGGLHRDSLMV